MRRRLTRGLLALYLGLLLASHAVRWVRPEPRAGVGGLGVQRQTVAVVDGGRRGERPVSMTYVEYRPAVRGPLPTLIAVHGSPGSRRDFDRLGPLLAREARVVAPDLPGFGASTRRLPDYSIAAHADYLEQFLDGLDIDEAHLLGFSMGGGPVLELAAGAPERVLSVTLLSAIGVQELELLGSYPLNHAVHGLQLAGFWALTELVPHFGALDGVFFGIEYARNFYDSDQRPLRGILERLPQPTLVIHGARDPLVPAATAREHHRIVPQSELVMLDDDHFMTFRAPPAIAEPIADFIGRVERGEAPSRAAAAPERLAAAARPFDPRAVPAASALALVVMMTLIALATFVSEDLTSIATGVLVAQGRIGFAAGVVACFAGILIGDLAIFAAGRWLGRRWLGRAPLKWLLPAERVAGASLWFEQRGPVVILLSRFLPGTRVATYFAAGLLRTSFSRFLGYFVLAVALWTPLLVALAQAVGERALELLSAYERYALPLFVAIALGGFLALRLLQSLLTARGRRRWVGWWRRKRQWEFWPPWLFYPPLVVYVLWLGLKHRSPTLFTAVNPAFPAAGFVGESKADILELLPASAVAPWIRLPSTAAPAERRKRLAAFLDETGLPVVLKPDVGERGRGVVVARSRQAAYSALESAGEAIAQRFVEGAEYGVFYARLPGEPRGRIFSITRKLLPAVYGDGRSTLEELVLADPRAVSMADVYLRGAAAERIPAGGERVPLTELGTHCRGAVFLDGGHLATPELEAWIDEVSRAVEGFYFGRYDLKAPSEDALRAAADLRILELNGVTSEATHIYDPKHRLVDAYRVLFEQWRLAFEIGRRNRERGAAVTPLGELARLLAGSRRR